MSDDDPDQSDRPGGPGDGPDQGSPPGLGAQVRRSILRHGCEDSLPNRLAAVGTNLLLHLHPARVPRRALRFSHTFCAGGIAFLLFLVTLATGLVLMLFYRPSPDLAPTDVTALVQQVPFGGFLRALHRWAGDGMVIAVLLHMVRVLLAGAYRPPREMNWVVGVGLLLITLGIAFTGYLLPWTQQGYWATTVAGELLGQAPLAGAQGPAALVGPGRDLRALLLGGSAVGPATLARFHALHCAILPLAGGLLMALHFWRVRKDGISEPL